MERIFIKTVTLVLLTVWTSFAAILPDSKYPMPTADILGILNEITEDKHPYVEFKELMSSVIALFRQEYTFSVDTASVNLETTAILSIPDTPAEHLQSLPFYNELVFYGVTSYWNPAFEDLYIAYKTDNLSWVDAVTFVNIGLNNKFYTNVKDITDPEQLTVLLNKYHCISSNYVPKELVLIKDAYSTNSLKLRKDAHTALEKMCIAAKADHITLLAVSAYRSYDYQKMVYDKKKSAGVSLEEYQIKRDKTVARSGYSEHQTGLAVDIGTTDDSTLQQSFENTDAGKWLAKNSYRFGFILRYPKGKENITGYNYEPWHFRYLGIALAEKVFLSGLTYDEFCARNLLVTSQSK